MSELKSKETKSKTTFIETDGQSAAELERLLNKQTNTRAYDPHFPLVTIRCDRDNNPRRWYHEDEHGNRQYVDAAILADVAFVIERDGRGCGQTTNIGLAIGIKLPHGYPVTVRTGEVKHLEFNARRGCFVLKGSDTEIKACRFLFLMEGCHSAYVE